MHNPHPLRMLFSFTDVRLTQKGNLTVASGVQNWVLLQCYCSVPRQHIAQLTSAISVCTMPGPISAKVVHTSMINTGVDVIASGLVQMVHTCMIKTLQ